MRKNTNRFAAVLTPLFAFLLGTILVIVGGSALWAAEDKLDIPRMIQESPHFSDHPGADGVIWLRELDYSLRADGAMVRTTRLVVLARQGVGDQWTRWSIPIPEGGEAKVVSAALYDPGSGRIISPVLPTAGEESGVAYTEVLFPDLQDEFIIVLSLNEILPRKFAAEDFLWINESLPVWEQKISVTAPVGMELAVQSSGIGEPSREMTASGERYVWHVVNSDSWSGRTLKRDDRAFLAFSTRKGSEPAARYLDGLEKMLLPQPPAAVKSILGQANKQKAGSELIRWMEKAPGFSRGFPDSFVRPDIPGEGPWTPWEKVLLLNRWIRSAGWDSSLHWLAAYSFDLLSPVPEGALIRPVTELHIAGVPSFFCDLGRGSSPNETPPSLWGRLLYTPSQNILNGRVVSGSTASEHRLSIDWVLDLARDGLASGRVDVLIRNGWVGFFFPGGTPTDESMGRLAAELFPGMRLVDGGVSFAPIKYGWKVTLRPEPRQSIVSGGAMLALFPGATPFWLEELGDGRSNYRLAFPFVIEQNLTFRLPPKTDLVMAPSSASRTLERVKYEESVYHNKRRNTLTAGSKIVLSAENVTDGIGRSLAEAVGRWMAYASRTFPFRVR